METIGFFDDPNTDLKEVAQIITDSWYQIDSERANFWDKYKAILADVSVLEASKTMAI